MKIYKVWVIVEEIDEDEDHYEDVGEPFDIGKFDTEEAAFKCAANTAGVNNEKNEG